MAHRTCTKLAPPRLESVRDPGGPVRLASQQFAPRMLRTFIRDRGAQVTLGTFVATFSYAMLVLISIGSTLVPHLSVTVALALTVIDLGVLIYCIHHMATAIQLPAVIPVRRKPVSVCTTSSGQWPGGVPCAPDQWHWCRTRGFVRELWDLGSGIWPQFRDGYGSLPPASSGL